jgi:hypothetical protein
MATYGAGDSEAFDAGEEQQFDFATARQKTVRLVRVVGVSQSFEMCAGRGKILGFAILYEVQV